jgi:DNA-binding NtrC family response regulator
VVFEGYEELSTEVVAAARSAPLARYALDVREGPNAGTRVALDSEAPEAILIGESPACHVRLGDRQISRRHARIEFEGRRIRLTDLGSTNGTFVDGVAIVDAYLRGGELVRMGASAFVVERLDRGDETATLGTATRFGDLLGASPAMRRLYPLCDRIAAADVDVLIEGETGTGKEVLAEALHEHSPRRAGPFIVFDCASVSHKLVESELFGHERGAFTGAIATRKGAAELANGGTLFIDEIGELPLASQVKLLRVLQKREVRRVGGDQTISLDMRVLSATRRNLDEEVQAGRFRDDLFHRLVVARIELPPLRRRAGDVALLAKAFWRSMGGNLADLPDEQIVRWTSATWPGNVRELRNAVVRCLALGADEEIAGPEADAGGPETFEGILDLGLPFPRARQMAISEFERRYVERALTEHGGNITRAAAASGIGRRYFHDLKRGKKSPRS